MLLPAALYLNLNQSFQQSHSLSASLSLSPSKYKSNQCSKHRQNDLILFCKDSICSYIPLCALCIPEHCERHSKINTIPKFYEISKAKNDCQYKLKVMENKLKIIDEIIEHHLSLLSYPISTNINVDNINSRRSMNNNNNTKIIFKYLELISKLNECKERIVDCINRLFNEVKLNIESNLTNDPNNESINTGGSIVILKTKIETFINEIHEYENEIINGGKKQYEIINKILSTNELDTKIEQFQEKLQRQEIINIRYGQSANELSFAENNPSHNKLIEPIINIDIEPTIYAIEDQLKIFFDNIGLSSSIPLFTRSNCQTHMFDTTNKNNGRNYQDELFCKTCGKNSNITRSYDSLASTAGNIDKKKENDELEAKIKSFENSDVPILVFSEEKKKQKIMPPPSSIKRSSSKLIKSKFNSMYSPNRKKIHMNPEADDQGYQAGKENFPHNEYSNTNATPGIFERLLVSDIESNNKNRLNGNTTIDLDRIEEEGEYHQDDYITSNSASSHSKINYDEITPIKPNQLDDLSNFCSPDLRLLSGQSLLLKSLNTTNMKNLPYSKARKNEEEEELAIKEIDQNNQDHDIPDSLNNNSKELIKNNSDLELNRENKISDDWVEIAHDSQSNPNYEFQINQIQIDQNNQNCDHIDISSPEQKLPNESFISSTSKDSQSEDELNELQNQINSKGQILENEEDVKSIMSNATSIQNKEFSSQKKLEKYNNFFTVENYSISDKDSERTLSDYDQTPNKIEWPQVDVLSLKMRTECVSDIKSSSDGNLSINPKASPDFNQDPQSFPITKPKTFPKPLEFKITLPNYFMPDTKKYMHFFQWRSKCLHLLPIDSSFLNKIGLKFQTIQLNIDYLIPSYHASIMTPNGKIFITGGQDPSDINIKYNGLYTYEETQEKGHTLTKRTPMRYKRDSHAICYLNDFIYVIGGVTTSKDGEKKVLKKCEKYSITEDKWYEIQDLTTPVCNHSACSFNGKYIFVFGGRASANSFSNKIFKYEINTNLWQYLTLDPSSSTQIKKKFTLTSQGSCIQINETEIFVFGGYYENRSISNQSFIFEIKEEQDSSQPDQINEKFFIKGFNAKKVPFAAPFWDKQVFIFEKHLFCLQNVITYNDPKLSYISNRRALIFNGYAWMSLN